jgi:mono/diheme cytochrome c family protein
MLFRIVTVNPLVVSKLLLVTLLSLVCLERSCLHAQGLPPPQSSSSQLSPVLVVCSSETKTEKPPTENEFFQRSCARCHGKDGKGTETREDMTYIPDFCSHKWQEKRSDERLSASILGGKGKLMPAFGDKINREKAQALVEYIRQFDPERSKPAASPPKEPAQAAEPGAGKTLYQQKCARCHGADGVGNEARDTAPAIPDFTRHPWHERRGDAQITASILNGKGKEMPAFGGKISQDQAKNLVAYLRRFDPMSTATAPASESSFEKRFQELEKEMEALHKQYRDLEQPPKKP